MHEEGFVSVLAEAEATALRILKDLLPRTPEAPVDFKAPVAPTGSHIATSSQRLNKTALREVLGVFMEQLKLDDAHFGVAELEVRGHSALSDRKAWSTPGPSIRLPSVRGKTCGS